MDRKNRVPKSLSIQKQAVQYVSSIASNPSANMRCGACGASKGFFLCHHLLSVNCNGPCHGKPHMPSWTGGRSYVGLSCSGLCDIAALHQDLSVVSSEALIWNHHRAVSPFFGVLAVGPEPDVVDNSAARAHNLCRWHSYHSVAKLGITWRTDVHNTCLHAVAALPLVALDRAWQYGLQRFSNGICAGWQTSKRWVTCSRFTDSPLCGGRWMEAQRNAIVGA